MYHAARVTGINHTIGSQLIDHPDDLNLATQGAVRDVHLIYLRVFAIGAPGCLDHQLMACTLLVRLTADRVGRDKVTKAFLTLVFGLVTWWLAGAADRANRSGSIGDEVSRGRYLVEQVAMCVQCHTPRSQTGELLLTRYLQGAPVPVSAPPNFRMDWAYKAPAIAGLPGYTRQDGIRLLMEGITPDGRIPKPPMPKFRLRRDDAEAVVSYLKSIS
jgi:mono/diheme cytochrome c family protein